MKWHLALLVCLTLPAWSQAAPADSQRKFRTDCTYPAAAIAAQPEGRNLVSYRGTDDGQIEDIKIEQSSGNADLDAATVQCVKGWTFDPNSPRGKWSIGKHRTYIDWLLHPAPVGRVTGLPHKCLVGNAPELGSGESMEGMTRLRFTITEEGHVADIKIDKTSGNGLLDRASVNCARDWRYVPAIGNDKPVAVPWKAEIAWRVPGDDSNKFIVERHSCAAYYPNSEAEAKVEGTTRVRFVIAGDGSVKDLAIQESSGHADFDKASLQCAKDWRYKVSLEDGKAVETRYMADVIWEAGNDTLPGYAEPPIDCVHAYPVTAADVADTAGETEITYLIVQARVLKTWVTVSSGNPALDRNAEACIASRKFLRAYITINDKQVDKYASQTVRTRIDWKDAAN